MATAKPARITCRVCDGWYDSDRDLREHMQAAHRRFISAPIISTPISAQGDPQYVGAQPENVKTEARRPIEEWTDEELGSVPVQAGRAAR